MGEFVVWSKIEQTGMIIDKFVKVGDRAILSTGAHKTRPTPVMNWLRTRMDYVENIYALIFLDGRNQSCTHWKL